MGQFVSSFSLRHLKLIARHRVQQGKRWNRIKTMRKIQWLQLNSWGKRCLSRCVNFWHSSGQQKPSYWACSITQHLPSNCCNLWVHLPQCWHMLTDLHEDILVMDTELLCNNQILRCNFISTEKSGQRGFWLSDHIQIKEGPINYVRRWLMEMNLSVSEEVTQLLTKQLEHKVTQFIIKIKAINQVFWIEHFH